MNNTVVGERVGRLLRNAFLGGVSTLALGAIATPSLAQQAAPAAASSVTPEIVVTGIRGSLQKSMNIKKKSVGVVDAISAEDIGKFPDSNLAAAIQRIPGVSVSRGFSTLGGVPTSTGNATEITVRGFGPMFNETLIDERQIASGTGNRSFDFSSVGADFVGEIDVLKTPDASLSSGAIGATVDIKYPKPFDHPGMKLSVSASGSDAANEGSVTPHAGVLFSDTFGANDQFGVLFDYAYAQDKTLANHLNNQAWLGTTINQSQLATPTGTAPVEAFFSQDYGLYQEDTTETRTGGRLVFQWRPIENVTVTLNDDYSNDNNRQLQYGYSSWFNAGQFSDVSLNKNGTVTNFLYTGPTDFQSQINASDLMNNEYGINVKWDVNDKFSVIADADNSNSWLNPGGAIGSIDSDIGYGYTIGAADVTAGTNVVNGVTYPVGTNINKTTFGITGLGSSSLPYQTASGPCPPNTTAAGAATTTCGSAANFANTSIFGSHDFVIQRQSNHDTVAQYKLEGIWTDDNLKLSFGIHYTAEDDYLSNYSDFQNNEWGGYDGYGPNSGDHDGVTLPSSVFEGTFSTSNFISGFSGSGNLPPRIVKFNALGVLSYLQSLGNPYAKNIPGYNYDNPASAGYQYTGTFQIALNPASVEDIKEGTAAIFFNAATKSEIAGMPLQILAGVRVEQTTAQSQGFASTPTGLTGSSSDPTLLIVTNSPTQSVTVDNTYRYLLPNIDFNLGVTDNIKVRFDASRTLTRAPINDLQPTLTVGIDQRYGNLSATGSNPRLLPYLSDNLDVGVEWYYTKNSYLALDAYTKDISNFITSGNATETFPGVVLPGTTTLAQFTVSSLLNNETAQMSGFEAVLQHVFGDTGFGFQANGTVVSTNRPYDANNLVVNQFALPGLADSANLVAFYDKHGFQARVAINWRDSYLDHFGQQQGGSNVGPEPTFVNANTQVDFSTSYDVNSHLNLFFEGLNLNNSTYSTHGRFPEEILDAVDYGSRFNFGFHWKM